MLIDFHTHSFPAKIAAAALEKMSIASKTAYFSDGTFDGLVRSMRRAQVSLSVNLPVMTSPAQVEKVNTALISQADELLQRGILTFGGMHPDYPEPRKELRRLREHGIKGIKLHPAYQKAAIDDIRNLRILDCASQEGLVVVTHAGIDVGILPGNWATVQGILYVLRQVEPQKLVLAHMGGWACWDDVEKYLCGAPVWFDTAYSLGPVAARVDAEEPPFAVYNLTAEDFARLAMKHGTEKIVFGSDFPWELQDRYRDFIGAAPLSAEAKDAIFHANAGRLLGLEAEEHRTA